MDSTYSLVSVDVMKEVNRIPYARLVLNDGQVARGGFPISDAAFFEPGRHIEIQLGGNAQGMEPTTVFKGLVVAQRVEARWGAAFLTIDLKDEAVKMTRTRTQALFVRQTDAQIIKRLIETHHLQSGREIATKPVHEALVQYGCTDWDFLLARAESNGLLVDVENGVVSIVSPAIAEEPTRTFRYGADSLYELEMAADAGEQFGQVESSAWDVKSQQMITSVAAKPAGPTLGNLSPEQLGTAVGAAKCSLVDAAPLDAKELQAWANAKLMRSRLSLIRGRLSVAGDPAIKPLAVVVIQGIGGRFNGTALVTGVRHRINADGWITDLQLGLGADGSSSRRDLSAPPAAGLVPAVSGLQIGIVAAFEEDPSKELRVRVKLPALGVSGTLWARLAAPDAGNDHGAFFRPEPGDEVVLGFFNDDPRSPVILGALYSSKNKPPGVFGSPAQNNPSKGLATRTGVTLALDDEKKTLLIKTPGSNQILLDDTGKKIQVSDQHGNSITLDQSGIVMKSAKDLRLEANGKVTVKGATVDIQ